MSKFVELTGKLDRIPHLDLAKSFDLPRLQGELDSIDPALFVPYKSISKRHRDTHRPGSNARRKSLP
jgi:hypothetical protein